MSLVWQLPRQSTYATNNLALFNRCAVGGDEREKTQRHCTIEQGV